MNDGSAVSPRALAERMIAGAWDQHLVRNAVRAGRLLRLGLDGLRMVAAAPPSERIRTRTPLNLESFVPGDRVRIRGIDLVTDLGEYARQVCDYLLTTESAPDFRLGVANLTLAGLWRDARADAGLLLGHLSADQRARLHGSLPRVGRRRRPGAGDRPRTGASYARQLRRQADVLEQIAADLRAEAARSVGGGR